MPLSRFASAVGSPKEDLARGQYESAPDGGISCGNQPADMSMPTVDVDRVIGAATAEVHIGA